MLESFWGAVAPDEDSRNITREARTRSRGTEEVSVPTGGMLGQFWSGQLWFPGNKNAREDSLSQDSLPDQRNIDG